MKIDIHNEQTDLPVDLERAKAITKEVIRFENQRADEVAIHLVTTSAICQLHDDFFQDPTTTDCISFPMDDATETHYRMLGEVFVCPQTAIDYAEQNNTQPQTETQLYLVHGLLHLMGYDDIADSDRLKMREAETRHMTNLANQGLWLDPNRTTETPTQE